MARLITYARKSIPGPDGREVSTAQQTYEMRERADELGHEVVAELVEVVSASRYGRKVREQFEEINRMLDAGEADGVMFWDLDRLMRQPRELEDMIDRADPRKGARGMLVLSYNDGELDLTTPNGRSFARGAVAASARESDIISQRVQRSRRANRREGKPNPGAVYGWKSKTEQDPTQAPVVKEIWEQVTGGQSLAQVARQLNERGVPLKRQGRLWRKERDLVVGEQWGWRASTLRQVLLQPRHYGFVRHPDGTLTEGSFEPILPPGGLAQVSALLKARGGQPRNPRRVSLTTGLVYCGRCGATLHRGSTDHGRRDYGGLRPYLACPRPTERPSCGHNRIPADVVDSEIRETVCRWMDNVSLAELLVDDEDSVALEAKLAQVEAEIADARRRARLEPGDPEKISLTTLDVVLTDAMPQRDSLEKALNNAVTKRHTVLAEFAGKPGALAQAWDGDEYTDAWRRRIFEAFLEATGTRLVVEVGPNTRNPEIHRARLHLVRAK